MNPVVANELIKQKQNNSGFLCVTTTQGKHIGKAEIKEKLDIWAAITNRKKLFCIVKTLLQLREAAAKTIQKAFRTHGLLRSIRCCSLVYRLLCIRSRAAIVLQKHIKSFLVRRDIPFQFTKPLTHLLTWQYPAQSVHLVGSFTAPPWALQVPLFHSKHLGLFYSTFFLHMKREECTVFFKFVVDSQVLCSGDFPTQEDSVGNFSNFIKLGALNNK